MPSTPVNIAASSARLAELAALRPRARDLLLAAEAVREQAAQLFMRGPDQVAVARRDDRDVLAEELLERLQVGAHVAVGRIDDHGGALHDVVAGEQHLRLLEQVAEV